MSKPGDVYRGFFDERLRLANERTKRTSDDEQSVTSWLADRKKAGQEIDPCNCDTMCIYAQQVDPYDVHEIEDGADCVGEKRFARSKGSGIWVYEYDIPAHIRGAIWPSPLVFNRFCQWPPIGMNSSAAAFFPRKKKEPV